MTEGRRSAERPSDDLTRVVRSRYGLSLEDATEARTGEESAGWRVSSPDGDRFVQRLPAWRTLEELAWCDGVATAAAATAAACVHALPDRDGHVSVATTEGPCMVFPFVEGDHPPGDGALTIQASEVLAAIHRGIAISWVAGPEPPHGRSRIGGVASLDERLSDRELDRWEASVSTGRSPQLPIHGDFYGGNLLVAEGEIAGVIDWSESRLEHHEQEVSWAMWEFCQNDAGDDLLDAVAVAFLNAYTEAGGPAEVGPPFDPIPWVRQRLRLEASAWFRNADGDRPDLRLSRRPGSRVLRPPRTSTPGATRTMRPSLEITRAGRDRMPALAGVLARAFIDDPIIRWPLPDDADDIEDRVRSMFTWAYVDLADLGMVWETAGGDGVAVWVPPGGAEQLIASDRAVREQLATLTHDGGRRYGVLWDWIEARLPEEPHWFLDALGVEPSRQSSGIGTALLNWGLDRARADGVPVLLETGRVETVRFYERFGFRTSAEEDAPDGGPHIWFMRLDP
jgi:GNAT superfamily N-acetyltransferase/Ser/Thr protein kinase RdoA (MazF antagonist)